MNICDAIERYEFMVEQENLSKESNFIFFYEEKLCFLKLSLPGNNFIFALFCFLLVVLQTTGILKTINIGYPILRGIGGGGISRNG